MANIIKEFLTQLKIQWVEWRGYRVSVFNVKRDKLQIRRAIRRARLRNSADGRTYYILRNIGGGFDEASSHDLNLLKRTKQSYFPKYRNYHQMLSQCFAIVTHNEIQLKSYVEVVHNIQNEELKNLNDEKTYLPLNNSVPDKH